MSKWETVRKRLLRPSVIIAGILLASSWVFIGLGQSEPGSPLKFLTVGSLHLHSGSLSGIACMLALAITQFDILLQMQFDTELRRLRWLTIALFVFFMGVTAYNVYNLILFHQTYGNPPGQTVGLF